MMPNIDGLQVCRLIREATGDNRIFIVMFTARNDDNDRIDVLEAGANILLPKPIKFEELFYTLHDAENSLRAQDQAAENEQASIETG